MRRSLPAPKKTKTLAAFSLLEILAVISLLTVLVTYGLSASAHLMKSARLKNTAEQLVIAFNEARAQAMRYRQPVRVVFSFPVDQGSQTQAAETDSRLLDKNSKPRGLALVRFVIPADCDQFHQVMSPTASLEGGQAEKSRRTEWVPQQGGPRPQACVGQWVAVGQPHHWVPLPADISITSSLLEKADASSPSEFMRDYGWTPPDCWGEPASQSNRQSNRRRLKHWQSVYPESYGLIPYPLLAAPASESFSDDEVFPKTSSEATLVKVLDVYGPEPRPHFPSDVLAQSKPEFFPYVEFGPDGRLMMKDGPVLHWELHMTGIPQLRYEIVIPSAVGPAQLVAIFPEDSPPAP